MRGREFIMKDAYSFDATTEGLDVSYEAMRAAYCRIFEACGLDYIMVEADTGTIGGSASHEFMVVAETGESAVVRCPSCGYAANVERAEMRRAEETGEAHPPQDMQEVATPGKQAVEDVARFLKVSPKRLVKTLIYDTEKGPVVALVRGDRAVNEIKLANHFDVHHLPLAGEDKPMIMGCYGVGIGRTVAAAIEQNHDKDGIIWPRPLAPFEVLLIAVNPEDEAVKRTAEEIYNKLQEKGIDVLFDDRDERPGVKFKDADLIGIPVRVTVGAKSLAEGKVEVSLRRDREKRMVAPGEAVGRVGEMLGGSRFP